eukprot:5573282-Pleurochrysis_carterae.AAC.4
MAKVQRCPPQRMVNSLKEGEGECPACTSLCSRMTQQETVISCVQTQMGSAGRHTARSISSAVQKEASAFLYISHTCGCLIGKSTKRRWFVRKMGSWASISCWMRAMVNILRGEKATGEPQRSCIRKHMSSYTHG